MKKPKRLKSERGAAKYKNIWLLGNGLCFENKLQKETFYCFPLLGISKQQQEDIAVSPQYWARAAASKVVEQQASSKISNFPFWFSQNQKTNSILRKGFEIENSIAVMSPLNGHNKGPYKRSFWFQHLCSPTTNKETNKTVLLGLPRQSTASPAMVQNFCQCKQGLIQMDFIA